MNSFSHAVPPGFRFHPTDEELVDYYLRKRVASKRIDLDVIKDLDLYRIEPWDLQELCNNIGAEDQSDYYFFSHKDKKYPTGTRTNRATKQGFWKATGRDKPIYLKHSLVGMRKTLVFYKGRAPNGLKLDWIMHEYRLETDENAAPQEEGWVVCRVFKKRLVNSNMKKDGDQHSESPYWYDEQASSFMPDMDSPMPMVSSHPYDPSSYSCMPQDTSFLELPQLQTSLFPKSASTKDGSVYGSADQAAQEVYYRQQFGHNMTYGNNSNSFTNDDVHMSSDWRVVDRFVASQLSHGDAGDLNNGPGYC